MIFLLTAALNVCILYFMICFYSVEGIEWKFLDYSIAVLNGACAIASLFVFLKESSIN